MSWRRFRALYMNLSPHSATYRNYERVARKWNAEVQGTGQSAWEAFASLAKPRG